MLKDDTLKGLDDAISELQKAIEVLPDSGTKKGLLNRFGQLSEVRTKLKPDKKNNGNRKAIIVIILLLAALGAWVIYISVKKYFGCGK
ncbi:MAG: hypothetical protein HQM10_11355 [Candidatus Riflebacteria bacterium]|nr:hypothetical protein [Candidatus Riflebacteria bacterium]